MKRFVEKIKARFPGVTWLDDVQYVYLLAGLVFVVGFLLLVWFLYGTFSGRLFGPQSIITPDQPDDAKEEVVCDYRRLFDGACVASHKETNPRLVAIMVENSADAWPLYGMADANIVYEALVEGDIPRYMAIFAEDERVEKVGSVRSVRPYFVHWLSEYPGAMYMHVGGSPAGLELIKNSSDIFDLNEFYRGWFFWRDKKRAAPHNVFTSTRLWKRALNEYGDDVSTAVDPWLFDTRDVCEGDCATSVDVNFSSGIYNVTWDFVSSTGQYERSQGRDKDRDAAGTQIVADTVIVQYVPSKVIDEIGRKEMKTLGQGKVLVFQQGHAMEGEWKKESRKDRTHFYDGNGKLIPLKGGKIWIEIAPIGAAVIWE